MSLMSTFITVREAAALLGVHENTVRRYADGGLIRAVRLPSGVRRLHRPDVAALVASTDADLRRRPTPTDLDRPAQTVEELIARSGARPVDDVASLARPDLWESDDELERFIAMTLAERERDR